MNPTKSFRSGKVAAALIVGTALVGVTAVLTIRYVLRNDLRNAAQAQVVIEVAKLRGSAERVGSRARGYLLTADASVLQRWSRDRTGFSERLTRLQGSTSGRTRDRVERVAPVATAYFAALERVIAMRRAEQRAEEVARAFEASVQPRRADLDAALGRLVESEEVRLQSMESSTERTASLLATAMAGVAVGALVVAVALALSLRRAFYSLESKQAELERTMASLVKANGDLEAFAGRVAHDLRTPLAPITLTASGLRRESADPAVLRAADRIVRCAKRADDLVEGLLSFSRKGRPSAEAITDAAPVVRATLDEVAERIASADITVETDLQAGVLVRCSESLFRQVVTNLVGNAVKILEGRDVRRLGIRIQSEGKSTQLEVRDSGPGISADALDCIFQPFYRAHGSEGPGLGLGLAIVRRVVDAHGGTVSVDSVVGQGTTFRVCLPGAPPMRNLVGADAEGVMSGAQA